MVMIAKGIHLFPFRTQKLSPFTLMVLGWRRPGRVSSRQLRKNPRGFFFCVKKGKARKRMVVIPKGTFIACFSPPCICGMGGRRVRIIQFFDKLFIAIMIYDYSTRAFMILSNRILSCLPSEWQQRKTYLIISGGE